MGEKQLDLVGLEGFVYRAFGEQFPVLLVLMDAALDVRWASPGSVPVLGLAPESIVGRSVFDLVHPDDLDTAATMATAVVRQGEEAIVSPAASMLVEFPVRVRNASGGWEQCNASGRLLDADGTMLGVIRVAREAHALDSVIRGLGTGGDLDSVLRAVIDLARTQFKVDRVAILHDANGAGEVVGDDHGIGQRDADATLASMRAGGLSSDVMVGDGTWTVPVLSATAETLFGVVQMPARRPEGPAPLDVHLLGRLADLTRIAFSRHRDDRLLAEAATTDFLTGLANRRHFESRLAGSAVRRGALPLTMLYVDLDDFKAVNDGFGHRVGDEVLAAVAGRLRHAVRPGDLVGRLGGDEFAVIAPGLEAREADPLRRRIVAAMKDPIALDRCSIPLSASVGLAGAMDETGLETVMERADEDMFARKRAADR